MTNIRFISLLSATLLLLICPVNLIAAGIPKSSNMNAEIPPDARNTEPKGHGARLKLAGAGVENKDEIDMASTGCDVMPEEIEEVETASIEALEEYLDNVVAGDSLLEYWCRIAVFFATDFGYEVKSYRFIGNSRQDSYRHGMYMNSHKVIIEATTKDGTTLVEDYIFKMYYAEFMRQEGNGWCIGKVSGS